MKVAAFASASRRHDAAFRLEVVATARRAAPRPHPRCLPARLGAGGLSCSAVEPVHDVVHLSCGLEHARAAGRAFRSADADLEVR
jgi:hypothetical protein